MGAVVSLIIEFVTYIAILGLAGKGAVDSKKWSQKFINVAIILVTIFAFITTIIVLYSLGSLGIIPASIIGILALFVIAIISLIASMYSSKDDGKRDDIILTVVSIASAILNIIVLIVLVYYEV